MDYQTARNFLLTQGSPTDSNSDTFLSRLQQGKPPIPGQVTNILLALKMVYEGLQGSSTLDRDLVYALHLLAFESRQSYEAGRKSGVEWTPILDEDIKRISRTVKSIFAGVWQ